MLDCAKLNANFQKGDGDEVDSAKVEHAIVSVVLQLSVNNSKHIVDDYPCQLWSHMEALSMCFGS
eukprot:5065997-Amphidinium_carterae.1